MTRSQQIRFWLGALVVSVFLLWILSGVLLPFVAGMMIAFILDPLADWLERWMPRTLATLFALLAFMLVVSFLLLMIVPVIASQLGGLIGALPGYVEQVVRSAWPLVQQLRELIGEDEGQFSSQVTNIAQQGLSWAVDLVGGLWRQGTAFLSLLSLLVITPVVAFYLLRDWDRMTATIDSYYPLEHRAELRQLGADVQKTLSAFLRGQGAVCLILGTFYAIGLTLAGLNFGLAIGMIAGILTFIPYVGTWIGGILSIGVALAQFDHWSMWLLVAGIFIVGQTVEGYYLTPKLVGGAVGLHPVWVIFALFAGGALFGFTGVLLAVPMAAIIGVLVRFGLAKYRRSSLYQPTGQPGAQPAGGQPGAQPGGPGGPPAAT